MEIRDFARTVLLTEDLDVKLAPAPGELTDDDPGPAFRAAGPGRPPHLRFQKVEVPSIEGMADPAQRPRILHALANHELQAAELFAWALLAFPDAPPEFRRGLLRILDDEQRHTRMYIARVEDAGARFGDFPVHGYFWGKVETITTPLRFLCAMSLTFENANLDHTEEYAEAARRAGDVKTADGDRARPSRRDRPRPLRLDLAPGLQREGRVRLGRLPGQPHLAATAGPRPRPDLRPRGARGRGIRSRLHPPHRAERAVRRIVGNLLWEDDLAPRRTTPPRTVLETVSGLGTLLRVFARDGRPSLDAVAGRS